VGTCSYSDASSTVRNSIESCSLCTNWCRYHSQSSKGSDGQYSPSIGYECHARGWFGSMREL